MSALSTDLTAEQLRKAAELKDRIEELEAQVASILGGSRPAKKRGRPPGSGAKPRVATAKKKGGKRKMSPEGRARIVAAQKKRWAAIKKQKKS